MTQPDMFVEAADRQLFAGIRSLQFVISRLPSKPMLTPVDIATALDTKVDTVYRWIDSGCFEYMDIGSSSKTTEDEKKKRRYRIERISFLSFLKSRINRI